MATDTRLIEGEVAEDTETQVMDVQKMLAGFLRSLLDEQKSAMEAAPGEKSQ